MKVAFTNVENKPGYAEIVVTDIHNPMDGEWRVILASSSGKFATGKMGAPFSDTELSFPVKGVSKGEDSVSLEFGPAVVDYLDPLTNYKISLTRPDGVLAGNVTMGIKEVIRSTDKNLVQKDDFEPEPAAPPTEPRSSMFGGGVNAAEASTASAGPVLDIVEPDSIEEVPLEKPGSDEPKQDAEADAAADSISAAEATAESAPDILEMPPKKSGAKTGIMIAAIIALLILIGILVWLYYGPEPDSGSKSAAKQEIAIEEQVKAFMGRPDKNGAHAVELAARLKPGNDAEKDAIYRLYYFAAQNGDPEGAFKYAEIVDPSTPQWGSIEKDGALAWDMYEKASAGNASGAVAARENLEKWLVEDAGKGNANARKWLEEIRKQK